MLCRRSLENGANLRALFLAGSRAIPRSAPGDRAPAGRRLNTSRSSRSDRNQPVDQEPPFERCRCPLVAKRRRRRWSRCPSIVPRDVPESVVNARRTSRPLQYVVERRVAGRIGRDQPREERRREKSRVDTMMYYSCAIETVCRPRPVAACPRCRRYAKRHCPSRRRGSSRSSSVLISVDICAATTSSASASLAQGLHRLSHAAGSVRRLPVYTTVT